MRFLRFGFRFGIGPCGCVEGPWCVSNFNSSCLRASSSDSVTSEVQLPTLGNFVVACLLHGGVEIEELAIQAVRQFATFAYGALRLGAGQGMLQHFGDERLDEMKGSSRDLIAKGLFDWVLESVRQAGPVQHRNLESAVLYLFRLRVLASATLQDPTKNVEELLGNDVNRISAFYQATCLLSLACSRPFGVHGVEARNPSHIPLHSRTRRRSARPTGHGQSRNSEMQASFRYSGMVVCLEI